MKVKNVAKYANEKKYMVVRHVCGEYWFYDAWDDFGKATAQANEVDGQVVPVAEVEA